MTLVGWIPACHTAPSIDRFRARLPCDWRCGGAIRACKCGVNRARNRARLSVEGGMRSNDDGPMVQLVQSTHTLLMFSSFNCCLLLACVQPACYGSAPRTIQWVAAVGFAHASIESCDSITCIRSIDRSIPIQDLLGGEMQRHRQAGRLTHNVHNKTRDSHPTPPKPTAQRSPSQGRGATQNGRHHGGGGGGGRGRRRGRGRGQRRWVGFVCVPVCRVCVYGWRGQKGKGGTHSDSSSFDPPHPYTYTQPSAPNYRRIGRGRGGGGGGGRCCCGGGSRLLVVVWGGDPGAAGVRGRGGGAGVLAAEAA